MVRVSIKAPRLSAALRRKRRLWPLTALLVRYIQDYEQVGVMMLMRFIADGDISSPDAFRTSCMKQGMNAYCCLAGNEEETEGLVCAAVPEDAPSR